MPPWLPVLAVCIVLGLLVAYLFGCAYDDYLERREFGGVAEREAAAKAMERR